MKIYTEIYGDYDNVIVQPVVDGVEYVMFTDKPREAKGWNVVIDNRLPELHPRMRAKWFKLHSHEIFPDDISVHIDGNNQLTTPEKVKELEQYCKGDIAISKHEWRKCIYEEAKASIPMTKYHNLPISAQVFSYRQEGMPENFGLWACNCLIRDGKNKKTAELNELWWQENLKWTYQDQLSLPYLIWKYKFDIYTIPIDLYASSDTIKLVQHNSHG